jgi:hypothetical protein
MKKILLSLTFFTSAFFSAKAQSTCSVTPAPVITAQYAPACTGFNDTIYANAFLNKGLVAYYPFNGDANDYSGNNYNATPTGVTLATDRFGVANKCYSFNGTGTYVQCPQAVYFTGGDYTISGWVNVSSLGSWARLMDFGNGSPSNNVLVSLNANNSNNLDASNDGGNNFTSGQLIDYNAWVQVLFTYHAGSQTSTCYYNGLAVDSGNIPAPANIVRQFNYIGLSNWGSDGGVFGSLDDIRIYNRALSGAEITQLYNFEAVTESQTTYSWSTGATTPYVVANASTPSATGYTVTQTSNGIGCVKTNTTTITSVNCTAALNFTGTNDYVDLGSTIDLSVSYTKEAWVYTTDASQANNVVSSRQAPFWLNGGSLSATNSFGVGATVSDLSSFPNNVWTHVAVTYDNASSTMTLYKNGIQVAQNTSIGAIGTTEDLQIGAYVGGSNMTGAIDEVLIWNTARTASQIQADMACHTSSDPNLIAYYNFDQGVPNQNNTSVTTVTDMSGNGNTGTLTSFVLTGTTSNFVPDAGQGAVMPTITSVVASNTVVCSGTTTTLTVNGTANSFTWGANAANATTTNVIINPTATATYVVTAANNTCTTTGSVIVTVNPVPVISAQSGSVKACGDINGTFSVSSTEATDTYTWYWAGVGSIADPANATLDIGTYHETGYTTNNLTVPQLSTNGWGNYFIFPVVTNTLNCTTIGQPDTITVSTTVPTVNIAVSNSVICAGATTTLTASGTAATYVWSTNETTASISPSPTVTANYTVTGALGNCVSTATTAVTVNQLPTVNVFNQAVCNNANAGETFSSPVVGTTFAWVNDNASIGLAASGTGYSISFTATNPTSSAALGNFTVTPTANGCVGPNQTFTITVYPTPDVNAISNQNICNGSTTSAVMFNSSVTGTTFAWTNDNASIGEAASGTGNISAFTATNPTSSAALGNFTVTPTANGCAGATQSFAITVNPTPDVNALSNQAVCNGSTATGITFSSSVSGTTFAWVNDNASIGEAASGTGNINAFTATNSGSSAVMGDFTVTPNANGCAGATQTFTITVNALPTIGVNTSTVSLCVGSTATLTANGAVTYTWSTNDVATSVTVSPTANATYTVTGTDGNGCQNMTAFTQTVSTGCGTTGIANYNNGANLSVYPNPSNGVYTIELDTDAKLVVTNAIGEVVLTKTGSAGTQNIDIQNQIGGVYFVNVIMSNKQQVIKLIKTN